MCDEIAKRETVVIEAAKKLADVIEAGHLGYGRWTELEKEFVRAVKALTKKGKTK